MKENIFEKIISNSQIFLTFEKNDQKNKKIKHQFLKYIAKKAVFYFTVFFIMISMFFLFSRFYLQTWALHFWDDISFMGEGDVLFINALCEFWGLGKPLWQAYFEFIVQVFTLNFGPSIGLGYH
ncbi:MAG: hypothetical protein KGD63_15230 [Candidatus Lokiarchaeota archaeon]|nr:hypothetical protein [Candidatus Lokiarchaeota archaeon]